MVPVQPADDQVVGVVQKEKKMVARAVVSPSVTGVGTRVSQEYIQSLLARNNAIWSEKGSWLLGFYFGVGDDRLWVPRRRKGGVPDPEARIINFSHPRGRQPAQILMLVYLISAVTVVVLGAIAGGYRW